VKKALAIFILFALIIPMVVPVVAMAKGNDTGNNKYAVVIGIANYPGKANDLWHADEGAREMAKALVNEYGFARDNIKLLLNGDATLEGIGAAIAWLEYMENSDSTVVFYFSGHSFQIPDEGYPELGIGPLDSDTEADGYDEGIGSYDGYPIVDSLLGAAFSTFESQKMTIILDGCNTGGMLDEGELVADGRVVCTAAGADQLAWDSPNNGSTVFSYAFADQAILKGKADGLLGQYGDGVSMEEALAYAYYYVTAAIPNSEPQIYDGYAGELVL
jgi:metacaspase-1